VLSDILPVRRTKLGPPRPADQRWWLALAAGLFLAGIALRVHAAGELWLDEAQSVAIARRPLTELPTALREDGSPPLYYALLHGWMAVTGTGAWATRLLSTLLALAALPVAYAVARRARGPAVAAFVLVLAATNPWLTRYATETRMYALIVLLVLLLLLVLDELRRRPRPMTTLGLAAVTGALLLTHYWALFLVVPLCIAAAAALFRPARRRLAAHVLVGLAGGLVLFLPWLPSMLFQLRHTGTPWAKGARAQDVIGVVVDWSAQQVGWASVLAIPVTALAVLGMVRSRIAGRLGAWAGATLLLGFVASAASGSAVASRYTAVAVPLVLLLVAMGAAMLPGRTGPVTVVVLALVWLACSTFVVETPRTQAGFIATEIGAGAGHDDTVAYCPDQLGPSVSRLLPNSSRQLSYPDGAAPERVDWVDYRTRQEAGSPERFAGQLVAATPPGARIWLVAGDGYTAAQPCPVLLSALIARLGRPQVQPPMTGLWEHAALLTWIRPST
jgi:hypothetical protein